MFWNKRNTIGVIIVIVSIIMCVVGACMLFKSPYNNTYDLIKIIGTIVVILSVIPSSIGYTMIFDEDESI